MVRSCPLLEKGAGPVALSISLVVAVVRKEFLSMSYAQSITYVMNRYNVSYAVAKLYVEQVLGRSYDYS